MNLTPKVLIVNVLDKISIRLWEELPEILVALVAMDISRYLVKSQTTIDIS